MHVATEIPASTRSGRSRHAEIAGAGMAGLTLASILARNGWTVRVHERAAELREIGAGLFLWRNALGAIEDAGALDDVVRQGEPATSWSLIDERGRTLQTTAIDPQGVELVASLRTALHRALVDAAERNGVEILTSSEAVAAHADGSLELRDGTVHRADVVVGADGVRSAVRESLGLTRSITRLGEGGMRFLVSRQPDDPVGAAIEHWNGALTIGIVPCASDVIYTYFGVVADDERGRAAPLDRDYWIAAFPRLESLVRRVDGDGYWTEFESVTCSSWSAGRAGIVGDAAHAMSPHLGQGACLAMANARTLAHSLIGDDDVETALDRWETSERNVTDVTQRWSAIYCRVCSRWPSRLLGLRSRLLTAAGRSGWVRARTGMAVMHDSQLLDEMSDSTATRRG